MFKILGQNTLLRPAWVSRSVQKYDCTVHGLKNAMMAPPIAHGDRTRSRGELKIEFQIKSWYFSARVRPSSSVTTSGKSNGTSADDVVVTCNSTQTPCDLSPLSINDELQPQQHHQHSGHVFASFAAIDQMRKNAKVNKQWSNCVFQRE